MFLLTQPALSAVVQVGQFDATDSTSVSAAKVGESCTGLTNKFGGAAAWLITILREVLHPTTVAVCVCAVIVVLGATLTVSIWGELLPFSGAMFSQSAVSFVVQLSQLVVKLVVAVPLLWSKFKVLGEALIFTIAAACVNVIVSDSPQPDSIIVATRG